MGRNLMIIVSDDVEFASSARTLCEAKGGTVKVYSSSEWTRQAGQPGFALSLTGERPMTSAQNEGAKILPFPGMSVTPSGQVEPSSGKVKTMEELESEAIQRAISNFNGNLTEAARALGIGRATLYRKVKQFGIDPTEARKRKYAA